MVGRIAWRSRYSTKEKFWFASVGSAIGWCGQSVLGKARESIPKDVSERYLADPDLPHRWSGYFAMRGGALTWLKIQTAAGVYLREDIAQIDILSERGHLERETYSAAAEHQRREGLKRAGKWPWPPDCSDS